jgi:hypothetical protein
VLQQVPQARDRDALGLVRLRVGSRRLEPKARRASPPEVCAMKDSASSSRRKSRPRPRASERAHTDRDRFGRERLEDDDLAAGEQRAVQLEGRVLRRGADQHDIAGLDVRQERPAASG